MEGGIMEKNLEKIVFGSWVLKIKKLSEFRIFGAGGGEE